VPVNVHQKKRNIHLS